MLLSLGLYWTAWDRLYAGLKLGRAPRTKETLPDFLKWRRVTRPPLIFHGLTGSQRTPGFWGVTISLWCLEWSTIELFNCQKKEILAIVLCIQKFQSDVFNKKFLLRIDCKSAKEILQKDVQNLVSKQIFARWQAILSVFDFEIEFIKGSSNVLPDFLSREFLQGK